MATTVIELNDSEIRVGKNAEIVLRSPGFACISDSGIEIGEVAARKARLHPRAVHNRFWKNLNQDPLQYPTSLARHNADLAFTQLLNIHEQAGKPETAIFAVPASFTNEQLALLLGLVDASPMQAVGLVDSAVAACAPVVGKGKYLHIDIQLHQTVLTSINVNEQVNRTTVQVVDNAGLMAMFDSTAHLIADLFIKESRFDPQHHPETEQALYDQIPACMNALQSHAEVSLEVQYQQTQYQARLPAALLIQKLQIHYEKILNLVGSGSVCLLSHQLAKLPGFKSQLKDAEVLPELSVIQGCNLNESAILSTDSALNFITSLPATDKPEITESGAATEVRVQSTGKNKPGITHILHNHHAYPLGKERLYLSASGTIHENEITDSHCAIHLVNGSVEIKPAGEFAVYINGSQLLQNTGVSAGDIISFVGSKTEYTFIHVTD